MRQCERWEEMVESDVGMRLVRSKLQRSVLYVMSRVVTERNSTTQGEMITLGTVTFRKT